MFCFWGGGGVEASYIPRIDDRARPQSVENVPALNGIDGEVNDLNGAKTFQEPGGNRVTVTTTVQAALFF